MEDWKTGLGRQAGGLDFLVYHGSEHSILPVLLLLLSSPLLQCILFHACLTMPVLPLLDSIPKPILPLTFHNP